jgi:small subunit ribosomal protein S1
MVPYPFVYRVAQYDPRDRDADGTYRGAVDAENDCGPIEAAYLDAVAAFISECHVERLTVRDPEVHLEVAPDRRPLPAEHPLAVLFGPRLEGWFDGAGVRAADAAEVVRWLLREDVWCRLEDGDRVAVHVGWDMYMYVCTDRLCPSAVETTTRLGLFAESLGRSPYERDEDDLDTDARCADDSFWVDVDTLARAHGAVAIVEEAAWPRYYTMAAGGVHPTPRPGSRITVWPQWEPAPRRRLAAALDAILHSVRSSGDRTGGGPTRCEDVELAEGLVWRGTLPPPDVYEEAPALRGITPGPDGTVSARWAAWIVEW